MANDNIIRAEDFIDVSDLSNIEKIIDGLDRFNSALLENQKIRKDNATKLSKLRKNEIDDIKALEKQLEAVNNLTAEGRESTIKLADAAEKKAKAIKELNQVEEENKEQLEKIAKLEKEVVKLKQDLVKASKDQQKAAQKENAELTKQEKLKKQLAQITSEEALETAQLTVRLQEQRKQLKEVAKENEGLTSIYQKQSKRLRDAKNEYKDLVLAGKENEEQTKDLRKEILKLDRQLRDLDGSVNDSFREIGKYGEAIQDLEKDILGVAAAVGGAALSLDALEGAANSNEEASDDLTRITEGTSAVVDELGNQAAGAAIDILEVGGALIKGKDGALEAAGAFLLGAANVVNYGAAAQAAAEETGFLGRSADNAATSFWDIFNAAGNAGVATKQLARDSRELREAVEVLNGEIERQNAIAGDSTRSFQEIADAANKALEAEQQRNQILVSIAQQELDIINEQIAAKGEGAQVDALLNEASEKEIELIGLKNDLRLNEIEINKTLRDNARELFEQELDFTLDISDRQKAVRERRITDERLTLAQQQEILDETTKILDDSFKEQIKLTEDFITFSSANRIAEEAKLAEELKKGRKLTTEELATIEKDAAAEATKAVTDLNLERLVGLEDEKEIRQALFDAGITDRNVQNRIREIIIERKAALQDVDDLQRDVTKRAEEEARAAEERQLALAEDREALANLTVNVQLFEDLNRLTQELQAIDDNAELSEQERLQQRQAVLMQITDAEQDAADDGIQITKEALEERRALLVAQQAAIEGESADEVARREEIARQIAQIDAELTDGRIEQLKKELDAVEKKNAKELEIEKQTAAEVKALRQQILDQSITLFNQSAELVSNVFENQIAKQQAAVDDLERQKEHELILAGDNAERRAEIENDFFNRQEAERIRLVELQRKQAIFDKGVAIANAGIQTALAVAQINANPAVNLDITQALRTTLTALVLATGAAQVAAIAATPIPQFWKGTDNAPGGLAIVDEKGAEIRTDKSGRIKDVGQSKGPRLVYTEPGDKIYTADQSKKLGALLTDNGGDLEVNRAALNNSTANLQKLAELNRRKENTISEAGMQRAFEKALDTRPEQGVILDHEGIRRYEKRKDELKIYVGSLQNK